MHIWAYLLIRWVDPQWSTLVDSCHLLIFKALCGMDF